MNYYELFGLPVTPFIDKGLLAKKYFELQKQSHPDFFTQAGEDEKEAALQQSARVNEAFRIFQQEQATLHYFLQLKGWVKEDEKFELPPDFLMEMMDLNETLFEADAQTTQHKIAEWNDALAEKIAPYRAVTDWEESDEAMKKLKSYYYEKKYLNRILDRLTD